MKSRAILFEKVGTVAVRELEIREPGEGEVLIETAYSTVSPGTELRSLAGKQVGTERWPFIPGYSLSGTVVQSRCSLPVGAKVYTSGTQRASEAILWGGHVGHAVVNERSVSLARDGADLQRLSFVHLAAIALRGVKVSRVQPGEKVAVIGLGVIGQLSARIFGRFGAEVRAYDRLDSRVEAARLAGVEASTANPEPGWADIVVDSTGSLAAVQTAIAAGKPKAWGTSDLENMRLVIQGSYPGSLELPYDDLFRKEATVLFPRDASPEEVREAVVMLSGDELSLAGLTHVFSVSECADVYARLQDGSLLGASFDWQKG